MALLVPFNGKLPRIHETAFIAQNVTIVGDVTIGPKASVWFGAVLRGDMDRIELGAGSNLQDNCVVHTDYGVPAIIGENVGIGHAAIIHGATVGDGSLIGMGARLLNRSVIGAGAFVAAGAVVLEGGEVPAGHVAMGVPAKDRGPMAEAMAERVRMNAIAYQELAERYKHP